MNPGEQFEGCVPFLPGEDIVRTSGEQGGSCISFCPVKCKLIIKKDNKNEKLIVLCHPPNSDEEVPCQNDTRISPLGGR